MVEEVPGIARLIDLDGAGKVSSRKEGRFVSDVSRFLVDLMENMEAPRPAMAGFLHAYLKRREMDKVERSSFLRRVEEEVDEKLAVHARTRNNRVRVAKGEITGVLDGREETESG